MEKYPDFNQHAAHTHHTHTNTHTQTHTRACTHTSCIGAYIFNQWLFSVDYCMGKYYALGTEFISLLNHVPRVWFKMPHDHVNYTITAHTVLTKTPL